MRVLAWVLPIVVLLAAATSPAAGVPLCERGAELFVEGDLRIVSTRVKTEDEYGREDWACLGSRPALRAGDRVLSAGTASSETTAYAPAADRYLGAQHISDGEGGPSAWFTVVDLRTRRSIVYANTACCARPGDFRVTADGALVARDYAAVSLHRRGARPRVLSSPGARGTQLAVTGNLAYWTERVPGQAAVARSAATAPQVADPVPARLLEPVPFVVPRSRCARSRGTTVVATPRARLLRRGSRYYVCGSRSAPRRLSWRPEGTPEIAGDRWLLVRRGARARVIDTRSGGIVTSVSGVASMPVMVRDGSLAWIDAAGRVLARAPEAPSATELAPASSAPEALAASSTTVYWTSGGVPHRARP